MRTSVTGNGGNLYLDYWNGVRWTWENLGDDGQSVAGDPTVINYQVGSVTHENVFVTGLTNTSVGNLYLDYWNGAKSTWENLGNDGQNITSDPAVINYQVGAVTKENVFATAKDGNLYLDRWNGAALLPKWTWENLGNDGEYLAALVQPAAGGSIPGPGVAVVADQGTSLSEPGDGAIQQRLLLNDSPLSRDGSQRVSSAEPGRSMAEQGRPDLAADLWSEALARDPLDW